MVTDCASRPVRTGALSRDRLRAPHRSLPPLDTVYELPDLLAFVLDRVLEDTGGQRGYVMLTREPADGEDEPALELRVVSGPRVGTPQVKIDLNGLLSSPVVRDVRHNGEPRIVNDIQNDGRYRQHTDGRPAQPPWPASVAMPLKAADRLLGLIYIEHSEPQAFLELDPEFLAVFAAQAAAAVDRARQGECRIQDLERLMYLGEPFELTRQEPVNVRECLAKALRRFQAGRSINLVERHQADLPPVMASRDKLVQALRHVLGNALEALAETGGGQLWLSTRQRLDGLVEVIIADDGPGLPPEILADPFVPGRSTKEAKDGLGLGLWWTHVYVRRLGGQVKLHSAPGQGTLVSIRLPVAPILTVL